MNWTFSLTIAWAIFGLPVACCAQTDNAKVDRLDPEKIRLAAGVTATAAPDSVVRIGWARTDLPVTIDGMAFKPFAGLGTWAAFTTAPHGAMVMGDTVVFQDEVTPAFQSISR